ncbi:MAG: hypothetical protein GY711_18355 [bacterium]|nr:hypothetical protein [bacterium]
MRAAIVGALIALTLFGTWVRVHLAFADSGFDRDSAVGMMQSDPGLLYYLTERVFESGGVPDDWRADPNIEHPGTIDVPATYTVGQEFLVAWAARSISAGQRVRLHVVATWVMGLVASLIVIGAYFAGAELGRARRWGLAAAAFCVLLPANYRTIGFVFMREDLSVPLFALHLGLFARAARVRTTVAYVACGLALGAALATWHAMQFVVTLEALCVLACFLWRGTNPLSVSRAWIAPLVAAVICVLVPALRAERAFLAAPFLVALALWIASRTGARARAVGAGALVLLLVGSRLVATQDFAHVVDVLTAKLYYLGEQPNDPSSLSFDARLMWQGPFATLAPGVMARVLHVSGALALGFAAFVSLRKRENSGAVLAAVLVVTSLLATWFVGRMMVVSGLAACVAAALAVRAASSRAPAALALAVALGLHGWFFADWFRGHHVGWYHPERQAQLSALVAAVPDHVPEGEAVAADFMTSTAILAQARRPIVVQPKWERAESRERVRLLWEALYAGTTEDLRRLLLERFDCRYLVVDRWVLLHNADARYVGGIPRDVPRLLPGTAAHALLLGSDTELAEIEGYELVWRSPRRAGNAKEAHRLFRLSQSAR